MKLISWNVNGIRAALGKGFLDFLHNEAPDILCLQETKAHPEQVDQHVVNHDLYKTYWSSAEKKGYSGTAIFTKTEPLNVTYGIGIKEHDNEGRVITCKFEKYFLVNVYVPNSGVDGLARLGYRQEWDKDFLKYLKKLEETKPVILCGDLNVAHQEIDLARPKENTKSAGFTPEERTGMDNFINSGFIDTFRHFYPTETAKYSWWSYRAGARERNVGWRIDYFLVSENLKDKLKEAFILPDVHGSDHCPVGIVI